MTLGYGKPFFKDRMLVIHPFSDFVYSKFKLLSSLSLLSILAWKLNLQIITNLLFRDGLG